MKNLILLSSILFVSTKIFSQAPEQDCNNAIVITQSPYIQPNSYSGTGFVPNEINTSLSCLNQGEKNDVWYRINCLTSGVFGFSIVPNNFTDDYDWAVYNLTNDSCPSIHINPSLEISCNQSGVGGTTGANGLPGPQNNTTIAVFSGEELVICVTNIVSTQSGYTINILQGCLSTAINDFDNQNSSHLSIESNAVSEYIDVTLKGSTSNSIIFKMYDVTGKEILSKNIYPSQNKINISSILSGIYMYRAFSDNSSIGSGKILVMK